VHESEALDPAPSPGAHHLTEGDLAGFVDRHLDRAAHARVAAHLDTCSVCQSELARVIRLVDSFRTASEVPAPVRAPGPRRWLVPVVAGALAAGVGSLALIRSESRHQAPPALVRTPLLGEDRGHIEPLSPVGTAAASGTLVFRWQGAAPGFYRLVVLTEDGDRLFVRETSDTVVALPPDVALSAGRAYFWRVDAIGNGIVASTGAVRLLLFP
jgi:hypothetical protein